MFYMHMYHQHGDGVRGTVVKDFVAPGIPSAAILGQRSAATPSSGADLGQLAGWMRDRAGVIEVDSVVSRKIDAILGKSYLTTIPLNCTNK
jgi:hypothetical protein